MDLLGSESEHKVFSIQQDKVTCSEEPKNILEILTRYKSLLQAVGTNNVIGVIWNVVRVR